VEAYVPGEQPKNVGELIKLNTNESPFPPSPAVIRAVDSAAVRDLRLYPDPTCASLANALSQQFGVEPSQVTFGNGSDELLAFCFHALCGNGAAFADITYGFYKVFAKMFSVAAEIVPLREDYTLAVEDYARCAGTVFIANPNAPTGIALKRGQIEELLQNKERLVIVDEAYVDFGADSAVPLLSKYDNLLVIGTFSKSRQLAGARLGYAVGSEELIADLNTLRFSFNPYNINRLTLLAGEAAVQDAPYFDYCRKLIIENRQYVSEKLRGLGFRVLPSMTNFVFAGPQEGLSGKEYYEALRSRNILVRYFDQDRLREFVRITIGTTDQMDALISATKDILGVEDYDCDY
jgi:histidinol-phosphate aminotransferase